VRNACYDMYFSVMEKRNSRGRDKALISAKRAIVLRPNRADEYYNLACVYALRNDKKNAITNLGVAIRLDNRFRGEIKENEDLKNLRDDETFKKLLE